MEEEEQVGRQGELHQMGLDPCWLGLLCSLILGAPAWGRRKEERDRRKGREEKEQKKNVETFPKLKNFMEKNKTQFMGLV
jgi:hypothetical protein